MKGTTSNELTILTVNSKNNGSTTGSTGAIMVLDENLPSEFTITTGQDVGTFTVEVK
jgi:hypothetical protein